MRGWVLGQVSAVNLRSLGRTPLRPSAGAGPFADNGLAWIEDAGRFGLVDRRGTLVHPPEAEAIHGYGTDLIMLRYPRDHG